MPPRKKGTASAVATASDTITGGDNKLPNKKSKAKETDSPSAGTTATATTAAATDNNSSADSSSAMRSPTTPSPPLINSPTAPATATAATPLKATPVLSLAAAGVGGGTTSTSLSSSSLSSSSTLSTPLTEFAPVSPTWHRRQTSNGSNAAPSPAAGAAAAAVSATSLARSTSSPVSLTPVPAPHDSLPNAIDEWKVLSNRLKGRRVAIFLDYDGTLTPIVDIPSEAKLSPAMRAVLKQVASRFPLAIVTGRRLSTITEFVQLEGLYYAGSHGFDIRGPNGLAGKEVAGRYLPALKSVYENLQKQMSAIAGSLVEDNKYSISTHYRNVPSPEQVVVIEKAVDDAILLAHEQFQRCCPTTGVAAPPPTQAKPRGKRKAAGGAAAAAAAAIAAASHDPIRLHKTYGKKVFEIRPSFDWDKGKAVLWLLEQLFPSTTSAAAAATASTTAAAAPCSPDAGSCDDVVAIYIGDDTTDEDAFRVLRTRAATALSSPASSPTAGTAFAAASAASSPCTNGVTIRVNQTYKPKPPAAGSAAAAAAAATAPPAVNTVNTVAEFTLRSVDEVREFLTRLCTV